MYGQHSSFAFHLQQTKKQGRRICFAIMMLPVFLALMLSSQVAAAKQDVAIQHSGHAFGPYVPNRQWTPIFSRIHNKEAVPVKTGLITEVPAPDGDGHVRFVREVELPPHSSRLLEHYVYINFPPEELAARSSSQKREEKIRFEDGTTITSIHRTPGKETPLKLRSWLVDPDSGRKQASEEFLGYPVPPSSLSIGIVQAPVARYNTDVTYTLAGTPYVMGEHSQDYEGWDGAAWPAAEPFVTRNSPDIEKLKKSLLKTRIRPHQLPRKWAGYQGLDTLILSTMKSERTPQGLSPLQRDSLLRWVKAGGNLVIVPTHSLEQYDHPFWQEILPVRLGEHRFLTEHLAEPLEREFGGEFQFDTQMPSRVAEAFAKPDAHVVARQGAGNVLAAWHRIGSGRVWFLALPGEAMENWSGGPSLWGRILQEKPDPVPGMSTSMSRHASHLLSGMVGVSAPPKGWMLLLLGGYLIAVGGVLVVFYRAGRAELAWPVMILLAGAGLAAALFLGRVVGEDTLMSQGEVSVSTMSSGQGAGATEGFVGFFPKQSLRKDVVWTDPNTVATGHFQTALPGMMQMPDSLAVHERDRFLFPELRFARNKLTVARTTTTVEHEKGVSLDVGLGPDGVVGQVTNHTDFSLKNCILRLNRRTVMIGTLEPDESKDLSECPLGWGLSGKGTGSGDLQAKILSQVLKKPLFMKETDETIYSWPVAFYGWHEDVQTDVRIGSESDPVSTRKRGMQLLVVTPEDFRLADNVQIPAGMCDVTLLKRAGAHLFGWKAGSRYSKQPLLRQSTNARRYGSGTGGGNRNRSRNFDLSTQEISTAPLGWNAGTFPASAQFELSLPQNLQDIEVDEIMLVALIKMKGMTADIEVLNEKKGEFVTVGNIAPNQNRASEFPIKTDARQENGRILQMRVSFRKEEEDRGTKQQTGWWNIETLGIRMQGHIREKE